MTATTSFRRRWSGLLWATSILIVAVALAACSDDADDGESRIAVTPDTPATQATQAQSQEAPVVVRAATQPLDCSNVSRTPAQTEGPYFKAGSPERTSLLEPGMDGTTIVLTGYVVDLNCRPIAGAKLDFWQADAHGTYDNSGYRLRGHQFTDENGAYSLETVVPGLYTGRTRHIHVKVQPPGQPAVTSQLYFPDEPANARDSIFRPGLNISVQQNADGSLAGTYIFMVSGG